MSILDATIAASTESSLYLCGIKFAYFIDCYLFRRIDFEYVETGFRLNILLILIEIQWYISESLLHEDYSYTNGNCSGWNVSKLLQVRRTNCEYFPSGNSACYYSNVLFSSMLLLQISQFSLVADDCELVFIFRSIGLHPSWTRDKTRIWTASVFRILFFVFRVVTQCYITS